MDFLKQTTSEPELSEMHGHISINGSSMRFNFPVENCLALKYALVIENGSFVVYPNDIKGVKMSHPKPKGKAGPKVNVGFGTNWHGFDKKTIAGLKGINFTAEFDKTDGAFRLPIPDFKKCRAEAKLKKAQAKDTELKRKQKKADKKQQNDNEQASSNTSKLEKANEQLRLTHEVAASLSDADLVRQINERIRAGTLKARTIKLDNIDLVRQTNAKIRAGELKIAMNADGRTLDIHQRINP